MSKLHIKQAVILAGGQGSRLRPFTLKNPKPMVPVNGKPFLEYLINQLIENKIKKILILTGYKAEKIEDYFGNGKKFGVQIKYSYTPFKDYFGEELKSGIRILNAHEFLDDHFLLIYCDNYLPLNFNKLTKQYIESKVDLLVSIYSNIDNSTKNNTLVSEGGLIKKYDKSRTLQGLNGVDVGYMVVNKKVLSLLPKLNSKFEDEIFSKLIKKNKLAGFLTNLKYYSIGDPERVKITTKFLKPKKIIFLDRDGVINKKAPKADYIKNWSEFEFLPGSIKAMELLNDYGYKIFIISNQAGIARGVMTETALNSIHSKMKQVLKKEGIKISAIYYCPHGWDDGCFCRKPNPGMLLRASSEHFIDLSKAIFIGDDIRDKLAGDVVGCQTLLVNRKKNLLNIVEKITSQS